MMFCAVLSIILHCFLHKNTHFWETTTESSTKTAPTSDGSGHRFRNYDSMCCPSAKFLISYRLTKRPITTDARLSIFPRYTASTRPTNRSPVGSTVPCPTSSALSDDIPDGACCVPNMAITGLSRHAPCARSATALAP